MSDYSIESMVTISGSEYVQMRARIEQLEAALREIRDIIPHGTPDYTHRVWNIARTALEDRT